MLPMNRDGECPSLFTSLTFILKIYNFYFESVFYAYNLEGINDDEFKILGFI